MAETTQADMGTPRGGPGNPPVKAPDEPAHWLVNPKTIRSIWILFGVVLALTVAGDFFVHPHGHFGIDATFGFYAWIGLLTCLGMILLAKALGIFLKRPDDYYESEAEK
jgi:hypothetical protein